MVWQQKSNAVEKYDVTQIINFAENWTLENCFG
jgi:hypothetical protein